MQPVACGAWPGGCPPIGPAPSLSGTPRCTTRRPETAEERALRAEITNLQVRVEAGEADAEYEAAAAADEADGEGEEARAAPTVGQVLEELEGRLARLQLELDARAKYARAAPEGGEPRWACLAGREGALGACRAGAQLAGSAAPNMPLCCCRPRAREPSPTEGSWRRPASTSNGGPPPRGFRDDKPAGEERAPRGLVWARAGLVSEVLVVVHCLPASLSADPFGLCGEEQW